MSYFYTVTYITYAMVVMYLLTLNIILKGFSNLSIFAIVCLEYSVILSRVFTSAVDMF